MSEGRIGADMVAVWMLEMEFHVACFPIGPGDASEPMGDFGYFDEELAWQPFGHQLCREKPGRR